MKTKHILVFLAIAITCGGIALGVQDTLAYWDYRSFALDACILVMIGGYWFLYSIGGRRLDEIKKLKEHLELKKESIELERERIELQIKLAEAQKLKAISEALRKPGSGKSH